VHTVIETQAYLRDAERIGMSDEDRFAAVNTIAADPLLGDVMEGTGGVRKFRLAGRGKGKSGGYRIVTYYGGGDVPVFILAALSKGETANLSKSERNELKAIVSGIADDYREGLKVKMSSKRRT
jgi:hypothetical protein